MPGNVTETDRVFSVRKPAWHGLANVWESYPTRQQAQEYAHPWEPVSEPVYQRVPVIGDDGEPTVEYRELEDFRLNARSDTSAPLGVVTATYEPVKNGEMYDIAEAIEGVDPANVRFETGGSLLGGRKVWLLLRLAVPLAITGDPRGATIPYYALQNAHDGSGAFRGQVTFTRIICDNTAHAADLDAQQRGTEFAFSHTKNVRDRIEEAKEALLGWRESVDNYRRLSAHMLSLPVTDRQALAYVERFVPAPPPHMASDRVMRNVEAARSTILGILEGPTCEGIEHTAYGLVQASIEYAEHHRRARNAESRFRRAYLDRSIIVADAMTLAQEAALA